MKNLLVFKTISVNIITCFFYESIRTIYKYKGFCYTYVLKAEKVLWIFGLFRTHIYLLANSVKV